MMLTKEEEAARQRKTQNVGTRTHPCLTQLRIPSGSDELSWKRTVPFMSMSKESIELCNLNGQPIFGKLLTSPSMKAMFEDSCCSLHFIYSYIFIHSRPSGSNDTMQVITKGSIRNRQLNRQRILEHNHTVCGTAFSSASRPVCR